MKCNTHILLPSYYRLQNSKSDMYQDEREILEHHPEAFDKHSISLEIPWDETSLHTLLQTPASKST